MPVLPLHFRPFIPLPFFPCPFPPPSFLIVNFSPALSPQFLSSSAQLAPSSRRAFSASALMESPPRFPAPFASRRLPSSQMLLPLIVLIRLLHNPVQYCCSHLLFTARHCQTRSFRGFAAGEPDMVGRRRPRAYGTNRYRLCPLQRLSLHPIIGRVDRLMANI